MLGLEVSRDGRFVSKGEIVAYKSIDNRSFANAAIAHYNNFEHIL